MKPKIHPKAYYDPDVYEAELKDLFPHCWHFVTLSRNLAVENDFVTIDIGGTNVVVQLIEGLIRAFTNVCTHRFSKIQTEAQGNRPLLCQYHGWFFDETGRPKGIPQKPHFGDLTESDIKSLCLKPWQVTTIGEFIFIACHENTVSLENYLGDTAIFLRSISKGLGEQLDCNHIIMDCNWKIAIENTLESYHVPTIHTQTFHKLGTSGENFKLQNNHSSWETSLNEKTTKQLTLIEPHLSTRPFKTDGYLHQYIFPNLTIASTLGTSFSIQTFKPDGPKKTIFTSLVYATTLEKQTTKTKVIQQAFNSSVVAFNRKVFEEDRIVCNQVQLGATMTETQGILSDIEFRVHAFQSNYRKYIKHAT